MLADVTSNIQRLLIPRDFGYAKEDKISVSPPTGTGSALVQLNDEWIEIDVSQAWFWTPDWQAGERKVDEYIEAGDYETFDSMEDFLDTLGD